MRDDILSTQKDKHLPTHVYISVLQASFLVKLVQHPKLLASLVQRVDLIPKKDNQVANHVSLECIRMKLDRHQSILVLIVRLLNIPNNQAVQIVLDVQLVDTQSMENSFQRQGATHVLLASTLLKLDLPILVKMDVPSVNFLPKVDVKIKLDVEEIVFLDIILQRLDLYQKMNVKRVKLGDFLLRLDLVIHVINYVLLDVILQKVDLQQIQVVKNVKLINIRQR